MNIPWNMSRVRSRQLPRKPLMMHGPVGPGYTPTPDMVIRFKPDLTYSDISSRDAHCAGCGFHVCSCAAAHGDAVPPSRWSCCGEPSNRDKHAAHCANYKAIAPQQFRVGDEVTHKDMDRLVGVVEAFDKYRWPLVRWPGGRLCEHLTKDLRHSQPTAAPFAVGDRVWHESLGPTVLGIVEVVEHSVVAVSWPGDLGTQKNSKTYLRRAGDTEWLRALPGETLVKRTCWPGGPGRSAAYVLNHGPEHWQSATDWVLAIGGAT